MMTETAENERGFSFRAGLIRVDEDAPLYWHLEVQDDPSDPDWAAWCVMTKLCGMNITEPEYGSSFYAEGAIL